jgi:hypothetical protein
VQTDTSPGKVEEGLEPCGEPGPDRGVGGRRQRRLHRGGGNQRAGAVSACDRKEREGHGSWSEQQVQSSLVQSGSSESLGGTGSLVRLRVSREIMERSRHPERDIGAGGGRECNMLTSQEQSGVRLEAGRPG